MARVEVRCCCDPSKLIGWLRVPDARRRAARFRVGRRMVELAIADIHCEVDGVVVWWRAVKANKIAQAVLRRIRGFEPWRG